MGGICQYLNVWFPSPVYMNQSSVDFVSFPIPVRLKRMHAQLVVSARAPDIQVTRSIFKVLQKKPSLFYISVLLSLEKQHDFKKIAVVPFEFLFFSLTKVCARVVLS